MGHTLIFSLKLSTKFYTELSTPCNFIFPNSFYAAGVACQCCLSADRCPREGASGSHLQREGKPQHRAGETHDGDMEGLRAMF